MKHASFSFARTAILSTAMLLPAATSSLAEEYTNMGAAPPTRYEVTPDRPVAAGNPYGRVDQRAYRYANPSDAYARFGFQNGIEYLCELSPASLEHSACNSE